ncbi:hypothetical protein MMC25_000186 [Agyrium rufum]|nr:hypothetical protein [Agyrium rufum]
MTAQWAQRSASPNALYNSYNSNNGNNYPGPRAFAGNAQEFRPGSRGRPSNIALESQSPRLFNSRPSSRHSARSTTPSIPAVDDTEAFPTLGSALAAKGAKKHHGKRGGHSHASHNSKENIPNSLADVVRMSPSPVPGLLRKGLVKMPSYTGASTKETNTSSAAAVIPPPEQIPWLETGEKVNSSYLKARQEAFKHGGLRNKFLQSAAQAWNRNDARAAKALSLRGQSENELMRKSHREAARLLYESRNSSSSLAAGHELYVDLHGLHPEEAIEYLEQVLAEQKSQASLRRDEGEGMKGNERILYAITGTGHHSKGGKDKVGKAVRGWLAEGGWIFREFSVAGDRGNVGGVLGVDIKSGGKTVARTAAEKGSASGEVSSIATESAAANSNATNGEDGEGNDNGVPDEPEGESLGSKVRLVKNIPTGPRRRG